MEKLTTLSLFSGMGGLDYGLERAGFDNLGCVEFDSAACALLSHNRNWKVFQRDIKSLKVDEIKKHLKLKKGELDLLVGGPPCQSYSKSSFWNENVKRGYKDNRGKLIDDYLRFVEELLPKAFLIENVPGFCYSDQAQGFTNVLKSIQRISRTEGVKYRLDYQVVNCANYGIPQRRERFFLVANRLDREFSFPQITHDSPASDSVKNGNLKPFNTVGAALSSMPLEDSIDSLDAGGKWADLLPCIPPGTNYQYFTEKGGGKKLFEYRSRYWTFLLKLSPKEPSWTIQASPGSSTGPFHWENRKLSARELARIQTIPDEIELIGNRNTLQRLIGNAVPSLMGEILGKEIRKQIFSLRTRKSYSLMPSEYDSNQIKVRVSRTLPKTLPIEMIG